VRKAFAYRRLFRTLIADWRSRWGRGEFPFLFVQLPRYARPPAPDAFSGEIAELREAQAMALDLPHTGMAVALDLGLTDDLHPPDKLPVAERLARLALRRVYGQDIADAGPRYASHRVEGGRVSIAFDAQADLVARGGELRGFGLAGADRRFHAAHAAIDGRRVLLHADAAPAPLAVRYAWTNDPDATLFDAHGLPAAPFRTDDWPGITDERR
jgi:sialate O-acetylesterase